jgi:Na+-transporting methylmalonyl-CoA/oxaloacetate decarboxylase gamma subunit
MPAIWLDTFLLMFIGMGAVFVFLLTLIFSLYVMATLMEFINPVVSVDENERDKDIAVVSAAVHQLHNNQI